MAERWPGIELRHLAALRAVAEEGSFHGAAARLGYTQSAISQQIAGLERAVGVQLIERPGGPRRVALTAAGELLQRHAEAIAARVAAAQADMNELLDSGHRLLRVGAYESVGARVVPKLLRRFRRIDPTVEVELIEGASDVELISRLENGDIDVTFADLPLPPGPFESAPLIRDPFGLVVQADSPLAMQAEPPTLAEIGRLPLICFRSGRCMARVLRLFDSEGITPRIAFRSDYNETLQAVAAAGVGVAMMPRLAVDLERRATTFIELDALPPRLIALAWHAERRPRPILSTFIELTSQVYRRDPGAGRDTRGAGADRRVVSR